MNPKIEFYVELRDVFLTAAKATNQYIETLAPPEVRSEATAVQETTFNILKFEVQKGAKLGEFETASKAGNLEEKWRPAFNILSNSNATIKDRYYGEGYQHSYWLYGQDRIFRQKLKPKA